MRGESVGLKGRFDAGAVSGPRDDLPQAGEAHFSTRQGGSVQLIAAGLTDKEIASQLGMSVNTVRVHIGRLFSRFHVHTRAALVAVWMGDRLGPTW
jgi:DNA-binding NarL/FixJ family response regulator